MSLFLRKITLKKWLPEDDVASWLNAGDVEADPIGDLLHKIDKNTLSIYEIADRGVNLNRVIAALAANLPNPLEIEYALARAEVLRSPEFELKQEPGELPDQTVNTWHWELIKLSASKLPGLIRAFREQGELKTFLREQVFDAIKFSLDNNYLDKSKIKIADKKIRARLGLP